MAKKSRQTKKKVDNATQTIALQAVSPIETPKRTAFFESVSFWRAGSILVLMIACALRFYDLSLKPFHHDEGVNGFFLINLVRNGVYKYDPSNYHGPTLYFFAQASSYLFGLTNFAVRFVPAIFGVMTVGLILSLRRFLGTAGTLAAALFIALSPGMTFISRYFIHELPFVFFTLAAAVCVIKFVERDKASKTAIAAMSLLLIVSLLPGTLNFTNAVSQNPRIRIVAYAVFFVLECGIVFLLINSLLRWNNGKPVYLLLAAASVALTFATKETAFISLGTMLIATLCAAIWQRIRRGAASDKPNLERESSATNHEINFQNFRRALGDNSSTVALLALSTLIFAFVGALFFSSFFTYNEGINKAFEAYALWTKTGSKDHTQNGVWAYLNWAFRIESPLLVLGAFGALVALVKAKHNFAVFTAFWGFGLLLAYTIIPYKTPWLAVNFLLPLGIIAGYGIGELLTSRTMWQRAAAAFLAAVGFGICAYQTVELNFVKYDDNSQPYVYAHTVRDVFGLVDEINRVAAASGKNKEATIVIASPDYWSLPWYLRDYKNAGFYGQIVPASTAEMVIGKTDQMAELQSEYETHYQPTETFVLRPGVDLILWVRKDLAGK